MTFFRAGVIFKWVTSNGEGVVGDEVSFFKDYNVGLEEWERVVEDQVTYKRSEISFDPDPHGGKGEYSQLSSASP